MTSGEFVNKCVWAMVRNSYTGKEEKMRIHIEGYYPQDKTYGWSDIGHTSFIHESKIIGV